MAFVAFSIFFCFANSNFPFFDKTKIMFFSTSRTAENVHFLYNEKEIETVTEFNYLGVTFTKNGKFKLAKQKNIEKATKAMEVYIFRSSTRGKKHNFCFVNVYFKLPQFTVFIKII
jgi:hypothetical protein